jgi:hypothetical protein
MVIHDDKTKSTITMTKRKPFKFIDERKKEKRCQVMNRHFIK